jgi:hypothetical protein
MASRESVSDGLPAAYQEDNQSCRQKDRADRQPEGQDVGLSARRVGRADPTHTTNHKHPGRPEAHEATRNRRPARAPAKEPPPHEQTWEQREGVDQVGKPKQPAKGETYRQGRPRLHLSNLRPLTSEPEHARDRQPGQATALARLSDALAEPIDD